MQNDRHDSDLDMQDELVSAQLAKYARLLEAAFVECASPVIEEDRLKASLADARALDCPDAVDYLGSVSSTVDRWSSHSPILAMSSGRRQAIPLWDILYLTRVDDEPFVQTDHGRYHCSLSLDKAELMLDAKGFVRTHRSYLVNISRAAMLDVQRDGSGRVLFCGSESFAMVSRRKMRAVQEALASWRREVFPIWAKSRTRSR